LSFEIGRWGCRSLALAGGLVFALPSHTDAQAVPAFSGRYRFILTMAPTCPASMVQAGPQSIVVNVTESAISAGSEVSGASASPSERPDQGRFVLQRVGNRVHGAFGASSQELGLATEGVYRVWMQAMTDGSASVASGGRARAEGTLFGEVEMALTSDPTGNPTGYCEFMTSGFRWTLEPA
jgi:hypothetical protein